MCGKLLRSCLGLCNPVDYSPPVSTVHGILQARILERVAISFSRACCKPRDQTCIFCLLHWQTVSFPLMPSGKPSGFHISLNFCIPREWARFFTTWRSFFGIPSWLCPVTSGVGRNVTCLLLCQCLGLSIPLCRLPPLEVPSGYRGLGQHHCLLRGGIKGWDFYCTAFPIKTDSVLCLVAQSCLTLCDPVNCSPPGSSVHGVLQVRILEWAAMPSSRESSQPRDRTQVSCTAGEFFTI